MTKPTNALDGVDVEDSKESLGRRPRRMVRRRGGEPVQRTRSLGWLILVAVTALVVTVGFAGARSYQDLRMARDRVAALREEIATVSGDVVGLRERAKRLGEDPDTIRRAIRAELGMVEQKELILVLPPDETP